MNRQQENVGNTQNSEINEQKGQNHFRNGNWITGGKKIIDIIESI